jgi:hypothetical protein
MTGAWLTGTRKTEVASPNFPLPFLRPAPVLFLRGANLLMFDLSMLIIVTIINMDCYHAIQIFKTLNKTSKY